MDNTKNIWRILIDLLYVIIVFSVIIFQFPYSFDDIKDSSPGDTLSLVEGKFILTDVKHTDNFSSIHYLLENSDEYYVVTFNRFPYWRRYSTSKIMPLQEGTIYEYSDFYNRGVITRNGSHLNFSEDKCVSWRVFILPICLVPTILSFFSYIKRSKIS